MTIFQKHRQIQSVLFADKYFYARKDDLLVY